VGYADVAKALVQVEFNRRPAPGADDELDDQDDAEDREV
jgi:hypothetical protein